VGLKKTGVTDRAYPEALTRSAEPFLGQTLRTSQTMIRMTMIRTTIPGITNVAPSIHASPVVCGAPAD
jgi:hypothetical protein